MARIGFYLFYAFFWVITWLPLPVLYVLSDICYVIVFYIVGYRKKVVLENLKNSFPEKSEAEILKLRKKFYHHLCDLFIEIQKLMHMPMRVMKKRSRFENLEYLQKALDEGRNITAYMSHFANWEYIPFMASAIPNPSASIYHPLHNPYFDAFYTKIRGQYGLRLFPMKSAFRSLIQMKRDYGTYLIGVISDQTPPDGTNRLWLNFLNQDTATFLGGEKIATKSNDIVVYFKMEKIKRGYYVTTVVPLTENPVALKEFELTRMYHKVLEQQIKDNPEYWLWTHRRWKRKRPKNEKLIHEI